MSHRFATVVLVAALATACSGTDDGTSPRDGGPITTVDAATTAAPPTTGASTTTASAACTPAIAAGTSTRTLTVAGVERELLVHVPTGVGAAAPLVVDFHGAGSNMQQQSVYSGFDPLADEHGFVVATPNGVDAATRQWSFLQGDDIDFARAIVDDLVDTACVDAERVFATGISSGAAMTTALACRAADVYRGFATVAASFYADALCADAPPRPFAMFHGTDDVVVPYGGGPVNAGAAGNGLSVQPAEATAAAWAEHHGCDPEPTVDAISDTVDRFTWGGCEAPVELYRVGGGGHTWPGAAIAVDRLGATNADVDASRTMLELWGIVSD